MALLAEDWALLAEDGALLIDKKPPTLQKSVARYVLLIQYGSFGRRLGSFDRQETAHSTEDGNQECLVWLFW